MADESTTDEEPKSGLLLATSLSEEQAVRSMGQITRRYTALHNHVRDYRRPHFRNDSAMDIKLAEPMSHVKWQSDMPRKKWGQLKDRLTENHGVVRTKPAPGMGVSDSVADEAEACFNAMWEVMESRTEDQTLADALADGQIIDAYGILHWERMDQSYPKVPDYEYLDELPEDEDDDDTATKAEKRKTRGRYHELREEVGGKLMHRETDRSTRERAKYSRARAGCPYQATVPDFFSVFMDRGGLHTVGPVVHVKRVSVIAYKDEIKSAEKLLDISGALEALEEMERAFGTAPGVAPDRNDPSAPYYDNVLTVATLWTSSEWYEFCSASELDPLNFGTSWKLMKSGKHAFGRPPFALVTADVFNSNDMLERYMPAMEGVFRTKENIDRITEIALALAERVALPEMWFEKQPNAEPGMTEEGLDTTLATDTQAAGLVPEGYTLKQMALQMNPAVFQMRDQMQLAHEESAPAVGISPIDVNTQSWTAMIGQEQANAQPRKYITNMAKAFLIMWQSIARDISTPPEEGGFGSAVWVYALDKEGNPTSTIVGIDPEDVPGLNMSVTITKSSRSERITETEHGASLLGRGLIHEPDFQENYRGIMNASEYMAEKEARQLYDQFVKPGRQAQLIAEKYGSTAVFTPDGKFVGLNGQAADPMALLGEEGVKEVAPPSPQVPPGTADPRGPGGSPVIPPLAMAAPPGMVSPTPVRMA